MTQTDPARRPRTMRSFTLVSFALNEEDSVSEYLARAEVLLRELTDDFEMFFVDDGSTDRTLALAEEYAQGRPWLHVSSNGQNIGPARSVLRVLPLATKQHLFIQTVDWAYDLTNILDSIHLLDRYDVLQGYRQLVPGIRSRNAVRSDNAVKAVISIINWLLVRVLFGLPLYDYQNVTIFPTVMLQRMRIESTSAFMGPEMLLKAYWQGAVFKEVPVAFCPRQRGEAKGTRPGQIVAAIRDILRYWWNWRVVRRRDGGVAGKVVRWEHSA